MSRYKFDNNKMKEIFTDYSEFINSEGSTNMNHIEQSSHHIDKSIRMPLNVKTYSFQDVHTQDGQLFASQITQLQALLQVDSSLSRLVRGLRILMFSFWIVRRRKWWRWLLRTIRTPRMRKVSFWGKERASILRLSGSRKNLMMLSDRNGQKYKIFHAMPVPFIISRKSKRPKKNRLGLYPTKPKRQNLSILTLKRIKAQNRDLNLLWWHRDQREHNPKTINLNT